MHFIAMAESSRGMCRPGARFLGGTIDALMTCASTARIVLPLNGGSRVNISYKIAPSE